MIRAFCVGLDLPERVHPRQCRQAGTVGVHAHGGGQRERRQEAGDPAEVTDEVVAGRLQADQAVGRAQADGEPGAEGDQPDGGRRGAGEHVPDDLAPRSVFRQVARVVGDVARVGDVVRRGGGELGHEPGPVEAVDVVGGHAARLAGDHADGDDGHQRQQDVQGPAEDPVHPVVAVDRQQRGPDRDHDGDQVGVPAEGPVQALREQHLVGDVESHVREHHREQRDDDAPVPELGSRLDHLRQPERRALGRVQGHEAGAHQDARPRRRRWSRPGTGRTPAR